LHKPTSQPMGATWQPMTGPRGTFPLAEYDATCQHRIGPPVCRVVSSVLPRHCPVSMPLCLPRQPVVTLTVVTCHPLTGPIPVVRHITYHVSSPGAATSPVWPVQSACHVALYGLYSHPFFFCLFGFSNRMRYLSHTKPV
jgi:hypothetical protein